MKLNSPIILALDYNNLAEARSILSQVRPHIGMIKIGLELFAAEGKGSLQLSKEFHLPVFLDLKLHDVPTTVGKTVEVLCQALAPYHGEHFLSVHCSGGETMTAQAVAAAQPHDVRIVGITALTSLSEVEAKQIYGDRQVNITASDLASINRSVTHFVCAPTSLSMMRYQLGTEPMLITPGIRASSEERDDHTNPQTVSYALKNGADWVVIGRPITQALDPVEAAKYFQEQADISR